MKITDFDIDFKREQFIAPFGFKGAYLSEMWQTFIRLTGESGNTVAGVGSQSVLWSDPEVFSNNSEAAGNAMMLLATAAAAKFAIGETWNTPIELQQKILDRANQKAGEITGRGKDLRLTFTLNSMVALDNAAWLLMAEDQQIANFAELVPASLRGVFTTHHDKVALIPLISYGVDAEGVKGFLNDGCCLLKIKIGSDPDKDGDRDKMLAWDKNRLEEIHNIAKEYKTDNTESGNILYYMDANGRYDSVARVAELLAHAERIGALENIIILEEPFPEEMKVDVSALPVRIAADESAHSVADVEERIELGYGAIALKPIAKTLSMTLQMLQAAQAKGVPCFCADLTVNPLLVEWNKNIAARIPALPGMKIGAFESNGHQNYRNWGTMRNLLPDKDAPWTKINNGMFFLDQEYYDRSGGILNCENVKV